MGDNQFVERMQAYIQPDKDFVQIPLAQRRRLPPSLAVIERKSVDRSTAIIVAHATGSYSFQQIADYFGVYFTIIGKIVRDGRW
ncbi:MAG TPA: hypothetical protein PLU16_05110 [Gallionellaceae bacterium]|nr:hypothetical protein [Gallionellaceae bacterium]HQS74567.1 hypothetical protein [Gallionellaceae bacterium]